MRKVCVVTGTRAEYGLLYWLMKEIQSSKKLELQIVVTGMHLSPEFGLTYEQIEQDGFTINAKVEMLLSSDNEIGVSKSMGLGMIGFADALSNLQPDLMVVLGDRFEIFSAVSVATVVRIPVVHLSGGETTEGAYDEAFRHSISKMSCLHFTATEGYRRRVIQLGENPERVFNVGALGIDNIKNLDLLSKHGFERSIKFKLGKKNLLVTFHPVTLETNTAQQQFGNLLSVLNELDDMHVIFTKSNADNNGRCINQMIDEYVASHNLSSVSFISLGQLRYLSAMQYVDAVVGNSSSGLVEAPSFNVGTINIGDRQRGRIRAESVIDCGTDVEDIKNAFNLLYNESFQEKLKYVINPFGNGGSSKKVIDVISSFSLEGILKKVFYNFEQPIL